MTSWRGREFCSRPPDRISVVSQVSRRAGHAGDRCGHRYLPRERRHPALCQPARGAFIRAPFHGCHTRSHRLPSSPCRLVVAAFTSSLAASAAATATVSAGSVAEPTTVAAVFTGASVFAVAASPPPRRLRHLGCRRPSRCSCHRARRHRFLRPGGPLPPFCAHLAHTPTAARVRARYLDSEIDSQRGADRVRTRVPHSTGVYVAA